MPRALPAIGPEDLVQVGRIALLGVARRFDPGRDVPFGGYLQQRLRGAMLDLLDVEYSRYYSAPRDGQWDPALSRRFQPVTDLWGSGTPDPGDGLLNRAVASLGQIPDPATCPEQATDAAVLAKLVARATDVLTDREKKVLVELFVRGSTLKQAGDTVGLGESRVCQIRGEILQKLRERLRSLGVSTITGAL